MKKTEDIIMHPLWCVPVMFLFMVVMIQTLHTLTHWQMEIDAELDKGGRKGMHAKGVYSECLSKSGMLCKCGSTDPSLTMAPPLEIFVPNFFEYFKSCSVLVGGCCPPDPPGFSWGDKAPPPP